MSSLPQSHPSPQARSRCQIPSQKRRKASPGRPKRRRLVSAARAFRLEPFRSWRRHLARPAPCRGGFTPPFPFFAAPSESSALRPRNTGFQPVSSQAGRSSGPFFLRSRLSQTAGCAVEGPLAYSLTTPNRCDQPAFSRSLFSSLLQKFRHTHFTTIISCQ